jgi:OOP family OmpA-OmpF porin
MRGSLLAISVLGICSVSSARAETGWYVGGAIGQGIVQSGATDLNATLAAQGITAQSTVNCKCTDFKLYAGYGLNGHFAIEGGYVNLGKLDATGTFTAPLPGGVFSDSIKADGWNVDVVAAAPVTENLSVYGRLGLIRASVTANIVASTGFFTLALPSRAISTNAHYGAGLQYNFSRNWGIRGEWEKFNKLGDPNTTGQGDIDLYSLGAIYRF